jgi:hypothetical protein
MDDGRELKPDGRWPDDEAGAADAAGTAAAAAPCSVDDDPVSAAACEGEAHQRLSGCHEEANKPFALSPFSQPVSQSGHEQCTYPERFACCLGGRRVRRSDKAQEEMPAAREREMERPL